MKFYAHTVEGKGPEDWQVLEEHLGNVSKLAEKFAGVFNSSDWGRLAGLLHDVGKYRLECFKI
ncbi:HD domain-containing protein [Desulfonatronovibrio magnus]|uniref:HD domain-containing protein n=1 Tax=Desulfonatronovibrio magnus TaxID=698827 RepID=UPI0005EAFAF7|nr:HD domain-containing protein [Desulfonatronovibrio magnus]